MDVPESVAQTTQKSNQIPTPRTTCIVHPTNIPIVMLRFDYLAICDNKPVAAAVLGVLDYWSAKNNGGWVKRSQAKIRCDLLNMYGEKKITDSLYYLLEKGYLLREVDPANKWDRCIRYRLQTDVIQDAVDKWSAGEMQDAIPIAQTCGMDSAINEVVDSAEMRNGYPENAQSLIETLSEIKNTSISNEMELRPPQPTNGMVSLQSHAPEVGTMVNPKPSIFKATIPENPIPSPSVPSVPPRPAQAHIAPLLAWFGALGDSLKPAEFQLKPYTQWGKDLQRQIETGVTSLELLDQAGQLAKAWYEYNFAPDPLLLRWDVGSVIAMQRAFTVAARSNVTVDEIRECLADMIGRGYWQGKNVPFDKLLAYIPEWRKGGSKPRLTPANSLPSKRPRLPDTPIVSILDATQKRKDGVR